jgi:hypothetical protein
MGKEKTQFKTGNPGKPKGATNRSLTRSRIIQILAKPDSWERFEKELFSLKGRHFVESFIKLLEFDTPRYSAISMSLSNLPESDLQYILDHIKTQLSNEQNEID